MTQPDVSIVIINKDEPFLTDTLDSLLALRTSMTFEVVVVDASQGRMDDLATRIPGTVWVPFVPRPDKTVTIPEQRNLGVRSSGGRVVVFIDSGCIADPDWLDELAGPVVAGEHQVTVGRTVGAGAGNLYAALAQEAQEAQDLHEAPTINLAFSRQAFDRLGGFDEAFDYGSDVDFTWRLRQAGHRLRLVPTAVVVADWGNKRRQVRRAYLYGAARARLYSKHPRELRGGLRRDPMVVVYPVFLLLLPLSLLRPWRWYPLLLAVPAWRARRHRPLLTVVDHLAFGVGVLHFLTSRTARR